MTAASRRLVVGCGALCLAMAAGTLMGARTAIGLGAAAILAGAGLVGAGLRRRDVALAAAVAALLVLAWVRGGLAAHHPSASSLDGHLRRGRAVVEGDVVELPAVRHGAPLIIAARRLAADGGSDNVDGELAVAPAAPVDVLPGDTVRVTVTDLRAPGGERSAADVAAFGRPDVEAVGVSPTVDVVAGGRVGVARTLALVRRALAGSVSAAVPEPDASLLSAVAFGIRSPLPADDTAALQDSGLVHLLATSGLKVALVAGILGGLLEAAAVGPRARGIAVVTGLAVYVAVAGANAAAVRSGLVAAVGLALGRTGRRAAAVPLLALLATVMLAVRPALCADVGFHLSFLGTAGIVTLAGPLAQRIAGPRLLVEPFAVTLAAQATTLPITAATFGTIATAGPVANALALPLVAPILILGWAGALLASLAAPLGTVPLLVAGWLAGVVLTVAHAVASLPPGAIHLGSWPVAWTVAAAVAAATGTAAWWLAHPPAATEGAA